MFQNIFESFENRRIDANTTKTGYSAIQQYYYPKNGSILEIQIADKENIEIRNNTHEEFKNIKYMILRNPEKYIQISEENKRIRQIQEIEKLISSLKIKSMRAEYKGDISEEQYKEAYKKLELLKRQKNNKNCELILDFVIRI